MSFDEITAFVKTLENNKKDEWERVRYLCFYNVISQNGTKQFKRPSDLFTLPWEKKKKKSDGKKVTPEEIERKRQQAEKYLKRIYG